jgi:hypothetical protein
LALTPSVVDGKSFWRIAPSYFDVCEACFETEAPPLAGQADGLPR